MAEELAHFPEGQVHGALRRCRRECSRLTLAVVLERIDDGRPLVEEAFAMLPRTEAESVVWTEEMRQAFGSARALFAARDHVAARMAFKERYVQLVQRARDQG